VHAAGCRRWAWRHVPAHLAGHADGGMAHLGQTAVRADVGRPHAGDGCGGTPLPALAQAARATCRLPRGAATQKGSFLAKNFRGGPF
jgi:hypothetical protein